MPVAPVWTDIEREHAVKLKPRKYNDWALANGYPERTIKAVYNQRKDYTQLESALAAALATDGLVESPNQPGIYSDKKVGEVDLDEHLDLLRRGQALKKKASWSQHESTIMIPTDKPIGVIGISDLHIGSWSMDPDKLERITEEIIKYDLHVILLGDLAHLAVKLRSVEEIADNFLPPDMQIEMVMAWFNKIADRVLVACWGNHESRLESQSGSNHLYELLKRKTIWSNGIAHADICVGDVIYKFGLSHHFRARSKYNHVWGPQDYILHTAPDRHIAWAGDSHVPGAAPFLHGGQMKVAANCGSIQSSGYAKRYFSLYTADAYPVIELDPEIYRPTPFWNLEHYVRATRRAA